MPFLNDDSRRPLDRLRHDEGTQRRFWHPWNEENREAVQSYNERIEREGLPLAKYRSFAKRL